MLPIFVTIFCYISDTEKAIIKIRVYKPFD